MRQRLKAILSLVLVAIQLLPALPARAGRSEDDWRAHLYSPTFARNIDNKWIIVDCWHSRIIWNTQLDKDLTHWHVMENDFSAHDVVYDGKKYWVTEDTEHRSIVFYTFVSQQFREVARLGDLGTRTHRLAYDGRTDSFLLLAATTGDMWRIRMQDGKPLVVHHTRLSFAQPAKPGFEIRTFTQRDGRMYFVSSLATQKVYITSDSDDYTVIGSLDVPKEFANMEEFYFLPDGKIFVSAWPDAVGLADSLADVPHLKNRRVEMGFAGSPYFVSEYGKNYLIPEIGSKNGVAMWAYEHGGLRKVKDLTTFSSPSESDLARKAKIPFDVN